MDLSVIYGKTAKGLRARTSLIGGLSSHLMKVLTHIDGTSDVAAILIKSSQLSEQTLNAALTQLENEGYIRPVTITRPKEEDWRPATIFNPMVVEEILSEEEAEAKAAEEARLAEYKAKIIEETRLQAERKAREKEEQAQQEAREKEQEKEKARAEAKVKAQLEAERIAREAEAAQKKAEAEARAKAEEAARLEAERKAKAEEAARQKAELEAQQAARARLQAEEKLGAERKAREEIEAKLEAERKAREQADQARAKAEEARLQAELIAQQAAEKANAKAEAEAKENARREIERIAREAEEAQKKAEAEAHTKAEKEQLEAERKAIAEEKAKLQAERKAKAEEDAREKAEQARLEAERKAKAKEEKLRAEAEAKEKAEQVRIEAENKAKAEEEKRRAQAEADEKAKADEKERARLEIARIVREAEEARKKSDAQAKEERQEAKRKAKAEQDARLTAERKAKDDAEQIRAEAEAEEKAKAETAANVGLAMEHFIIDAEVREKKSELKVDTKFENTRVKAQRKTKLAAEEKASAEVVANVGLAMEHFIIDAEVGEKKSELEVDTKFENTRVKAQRKTKLAAEKLQAKLEAEEKVKVEANEAARLEMERISREADEQRKKHEAEAPVVDSANAIEVRWAVDSEMDDEDLDDEEEVIEDEEYYAEEEYKVQRVIDKKVKQEAEVQGREEIKRAAREEAEAKSKAHARKFVTIQNYGKWFSKVGKVLLVYLPLIALLMIGLLHFINITPLVKPIEKLASEGVGESVKIDEVRASLWPQPHLVLGNVTIGANTNLKIEAVNVIPDTSTLFEEVKTLKSIEIEGLKVDKDNLGQPQQWINYLGKATHLKVEQIDLKNVALKIRDLELGPFDGKVGLNESKELKNIELNTADNTLSVQVTPQGSNYDVALTGANWVLPVNSKIVFDDVKATGVLSQNGIDFSRVEGSIYGGSVTAKAVVDWSNQWLVAGNFDLAKATLPLLLKAFNSSVSIDGKLDLAGIFSCKSDLVAKLTDSPDIAASFEARAGKINGVDLVRAVMFRNSQSMAGDSTNFDKLTGSLQLNGGHYQYRKLALETSQFHAKGNIDIQPNQDISGMINADLAAQSRRLYTNFGLAGKVNNVKRQ